MTPSLERCAELLGARTDLNKSWGHGHCPLCGSMPIMSDLREKEGFRYNICGFCHAEYRATRLQCPFCLETDTGRLEYYDSPEEPGLRVNACKTCKMYIKTTDFRNLDRRALPLVDDLESLRLDVLAREKNTSGRLSQPGDSDRGVNRNLLPTELGTTCVPRRSFAASLSQGCVHAGGFPVTSPARTGQRN